jgi:hypothetical protein
MRSGRKIKVFCEHDGHNERCCIAWFELRGEDLYWGPGSSGPRHGPHEFPGGSTIEYDVPADLSSLPADTWKVSHHASGLMHTNSDLDGPVSTDAYIGSVLQARQLQLIASCITKPLSEMEEYRRSPTRNGARPIRYAIPDRYWNHRHYFEFYHLPEGPVTWPAPWLTIGGVELHGDSSAPAHMTFANDDGTGKADVDLILAVKHQVLSGDFSSWRPDAGFWIQYIPPAPGVSLGSDAAPGT